MGTVAQYCDVCVCVCVCVSVCLWGYLQNHMRDLYQIFCGSLFF